ncbi:MAG: hypothetical protein ABJB05_00020 [Parafilimonas sp.]
MELKYSKFITGIKNCPKNCVPKSKPAYRYIHDLGNEEDFLPMSLQNSPPARILDNNDKHCMSYGISFFESAIQAREKFLHYYNKKNEELQQLYLIEKGNKIACVNITEEDGLCSETDKYGHFTFYDFINITFVDKISNLVNVIIEELGVNGEADK